MTRTALLRAAVVPLFATARGSPALGIPAATAQAAPVLAAPAAEEDDARDPDRPVTIEVGRFEPRTITPGSLVTVTGTLTNSGPGISTTFPATYVYDFMFQRGEIGQGAAAAMMVLAALAIVLVPYSLYLVWRRRREARNG